MLTCTTFLTTTAGNTACIARSNVGNYKSSTFMTFRLRVIQTLHWPARDPQKMRNTCVKHVP